MIDLNAHRFNFQLFCRELISRGIELDYVGFTDIIAARYGDHTEYLVSEVSRLLPTPYALIQDDKFYAKSLMSSWGVPVMPAQVFSGDEYDQALAFSNLIGYPVVLKPTNGTNGDLVFCKLESESEFSTAFELFASVSSSRCLMVEKFYPGEDVRFFVVEDDVAVLRRSNPIVTGDGQSTIRQLIDAENHRRMNPRNTCLCPIFIDDDEGIRALAKQGYDANSVLKKGETIECRFHSNVAWGGRCENVLTKVHPSYIALAKQLHRKLVGSAYTSIDFLISDIEQPLSESNYVFSEMNSNPGFSLHLMPGTGEAHNILKPVVDLLFPETRGGQ